MSVSNGRRIKLVGGPLHGETFMIRKGVPLFVYVKDGVALHYKRSKLAQAKYIFKNSQEVTTNVSEVR